jgi:hypothetical protein
MKDRSGRGILRCAIYTRVSTDQGLEQDFNSLDAQREASEGIVTLRCEVHRRSTRHGLFKPPQRPRATCSSPRPVARDEIELT